MSFVVDDVMAKAAVDGERIVAVARLLFAAVILVAWPMATWKGLRTGEHANIAVLALAALAAGVSVGSLLLDRRAWVTRRISMITVLIDALASLMMLAAFVTWPPVDYLGFGRLTGVGTAYLAILGAGVRLSRRGVLLSFGVLAPGLITLMVIDERQNGIVDTLANRLTIFAFLFTASVFAWLIAQRTRTLVLQGAQRAVDEMTARVALGAEVRVLRGHLGSHVIERSTTIAQALDSLAKRSDAPVSLEGTLLDGRFEIGRRLGAGGMGAVYEGKDRLSGARVAIKVMRAQSAAEVEALQRFLREARAAAAIQHPAVVQMFGIDISEDGLLFQVQERIEGITVEAKLAHVLFDAALAARAGHVLCSALAAVHAAGVVHRDVKPANVMLTKTAPGLKLLDFGVSKLLEGQTVAGRHIGTPAYMAPEQRAKDGTITDRTDVFAAGLVLHVMVTGELPSAAASSIVDNAALAAIIAACLHPDPLSRPSAGDLADQLGNLADALAAPVLPSWVTLNDDVADESGELVGLLRDVARAPQLTPMERRPRYEFLERLSQDDNGEEWRVRDRQLDRVISVRVPFSSRP